ncbi:MAG: holo-ACP synthase [Spirochaetaceae bacterium]|jgi:holo-[acyl-carrier protein] synthase|nr:holo-ACP synthase [Spirochaetaceae bacterium]
MIAGIGVDVVGIRRFTRWLAVPGLAERYFDPRELAAARSGGHTAFSLAARFAAKEAFGKALGIGLRGIALKDIMVVNREKGAPELVVAGTARAALQKNGANRIFISLSHEGDTAIAMVVLEAV